MPPYYPPAASTSVGGVPITATAGAHSGQSLKVDATGTAEWLDVFLSNAIAASGAITDLNLGGGPIGFNPPTTGARFTGASPVLHGISGGGVASSDFGLYNGRQILLQNQATGTALTIKHQSTTEATAAYRIQCPAGVDIVVTQAAILVYSTGLGYWLVAMYI